MPRRPSFSVKRKDAKRKDASDDTPSRRRPHAIRDTRYAPVALALLLALIALAPDAARAQQPGAQQTAAQLLRPDARAALAEAVRPTPTRTVALPDAAYGRLDAHSDVLRAAYRISARVETAEPKAMARSYLREQAAAFGWDRQLEYLRLDTVKETGAGDQTHRVYRQTLGGVPVWRSRVVMSQRADGQPAMLVSGFRPAMTDHAAAFDPTPHLSAEEARDAARRLVRRGSVRTSAPRRVAYPGEDSSPRLAWRLLAWPSAASVEWEVLVDARSGAVLRVEDRTIRLGKEARGRREIGETVRATHRVTPTHRVAPSPHRTNVSTEGTGLVFDPDPLSTAGATYDTDAGASFNDNGDASTAALRTERTEVALRGLTQGADGQYRLDGPRVRITGEDASGNVTYTPLTAATPDGFRFRRNESGFEAVSAYFHADKSRRYAEQLGFTDDERGALRVNPQGLKADDSRYFPERHLLELGTGGVDDAEDASVVWHEHAHALLEGSAPGLRASREGQALHEGWADYWAAAYARHLADTGKIRRDDWRRLFKWDSGDGAIWKGRVVRRDGRYPQDTACDDDPNCNIYRDGLLWAATLMEVYDALGRRVTNRLALASHGYLAHPVTFRDAAEAMIQADRALYDGAHLNALLTRFSERGLAEPGAFGPTIAHDPLPATEQTGGAVKATVRATRVSSPVDTVRLVYGYDDAKPSRVVLLEKRDSLHAGALPLPESSGTVRYFIEAIDTKGRYARLPAAPDSTYAFATGADRTAPRIRHTTPDDVALAAWPVALEARVRDRLALDSVGVRHEIENPQGGVDAAGRFALETTDGDYYRDVFPVSASQVAPGSRVRYRIFARDAAQSSNEALQPESGWFSFSIKRKGRLRTYDFETPISELHIAGTGCSACTWMRGRPSYGVDVARSGERLLATAPDTAYAASSGRATLDLPALNLRGAPPAYLVFWHWYDFEHDGNAAPNGANATLWDGGNVKISTDGGETWSVIRPEGGYNGTIAEGTQNPLGGERAFGGPSYAWRRVVVELPAKRTVRVRLEAGFDASNKRPSLAYAGWYVDDLTVTTEPPSDERPPRVEEPPPSPLTRPTRQASVPVSVRTSDDTGVEDVFAVYRLKDDAPPSDTLRLAMSPTDRNVFRGRLAPNDEPQVGDDLTYRLLLRDAGGRTTTHPAPGEPPLVVRYRTVQSTEALAGLTATGAWQPTTGERGWSVEMGASAPPVSRLLLRPVFVPDSAESLRFTLLHDYRFGEGTTGNVKIKPEEAQRWQTLTPEGVGYGSPAFEPDTAHPMRGEPSFAARDNGTVTSTFDLAPYAGRRVQIRLDAGAAVPAASSFWTIREAQFRFATTRQDFRGPSRVALDSNYPDPFTESTTLDYAVPERAGDGSARVPVRLIVYDALGRRVAVLVDRWREPGAYTARLQAKDLPAGVYFARLVAGGVQRVERLVVAR